jgi:predicted dehydrogenase
MSTYKVGVIGLGIGKQHLKGYAGHPKAEVVAIADLDETRLSAIGEEFGVAKRYPDPLAMLKDESLDIVSVCTPNKFHKPLTIAAFEAGAHVLCEKPMAMNAAEAREMIAAGKTAGKRLMINFSYRFDEQAYALKKQVDTGVLGEVYYGRTLWHRRRGVPGFGGWFGQKDLAGGGPLIDLGVHRLDLALWLMGYPKPTWVMGGTWCKIASEAAKASGKKFDVEDLAAGMIRFENGAMLEVEASWATNTEHEHEIKTILMGTKGGLNQGYTGKDWEFYAKLYIESEGCQFDMVLHPPVPAAKDAMYHFVEAIDTDQPHMANGEEGLIVMELLDALYESAEKGEPIYIGDKA